MKKIAVIFICAVNLFSAAAQETTSVKKKSEPMRQNFALAIHGGAGNILQRNLTDEQQQQFKNKMSEALQVGYTILDSGGKSLDAVEAVIKILEDSPLFNAGKGSVFTYDGKNEMDAAIMDGKNLKAGAVASVRTIKNPISAAKKVMQKSKFVFLSARGAEQFAKEQGLEMVDTNYFFTEERWKQLIQVRDSAKTDSLKSDTTGFISTNKEKHYGTVGCVALDRHGNLAAGTSTGGIVNKKYNRIGDSPLIGAGTYANNKTCAVSCTGHGEDFIRIVAAKTISDLMEYKGMTVSQAAAEVIKNKLTEIKGDGGAIVIDKNGIITMPFNTTGMFRGYVDRKGRITMKIF
jgi:beta-aspartyl-peptidase (threonine type)